MTNYRRLISYIYAYEGEVKGKNIGFAKLESRNGQCKLSVNVKKVYVGSSDLGVYLLAPGKEIFLGSIFIRSGGGEFRAVVNVENAADSGSSMDQCYGLTIHEQGDTWRAYTTIWEDAVAHAAEVELADVTSSKVGDAEAQIHRKVEELNQELRSGEKAAEGGDGPVLSSSPAGARQMSAAGRQSGIQKSSLEPDADSGVKDDFTEMTAGRRKVQRPRRMQRYWPKRQKKYIRRKMRPIRWQKHRIRLRKKKSGQKKFCRCQQGQIRPKCPKTRRGRMTETI